jgi:hypothetical protein
MKSLSLRTVLWFISIYDRRLPPQQGSAGNGTNVAGIMMNGIDSVVSPIKRVRRYIDEFARS